MTQSITTETSELLNIQQKILVEIKRQNDIQLEKAHLEEQRLLIQQKETDNTKENIKLEYIRIENERIAYENHLKEITLAEAKLVEEKRRNDQLDIIIRRLEQNFALLEILIDKKIPQQDLSLIEQHKKIDWLLDFQYVLIKEIMKSNPTDKDVERLVRVLQSLRPGEIHLGVGGTHIAGDMKATDINIAESGGKATQK
jgi:hypothetical protein